MLISGFIVLMKYDSAIFKFSTSLDLYRVVKQSLISFTLVAECSVFRWLLILLGLNQCWYARSLNLFVVYPMYVDVQSDSLHLNWYTTWSGSELDMVLVVNEAANFVGLWKSLTIIFSSLVGIKWVFNMFLRHFSSLLKSMGLYVLK